MRYGFCEDILRIKSYEERRLQRVGKREPNSNAEMAIIFGKILAHTHSGGEAIMRFKDDAFASLSLPVPDIKLWSAACIRKRVWFQGKPNATDRKTTV